MSDKKDNKPAKSLPGMSEFPPPTCAPSREEEILKNLEEYERRISDKQSSGEPVVVLVSDDKLKASVKINPAMESEKIITEDDVFSALAEEGIVHGIDNKAIKEIFLYGSFEFFVPVAFGAQPQDGRDAQIQYKFNPIKNEIDLQEDEQGNVDHHELNLVQSVEKNSVIAIKVPATKGAPGIDVYGKVKPARDGDDIEMEIGDNASWSDDGLNVVSLISGQPILRDGILFISPVYEVAGDVDFGIGNIEFDGSVLIHGNVLSDFVVKATDDIQIRGNVEKAYVEAGGNVLIERGLYGLNEGRVVAGDSLVIRFVESGTAEANRNITIMQAARHSNLLAGENLFLSHPKGSIIGGRIACGKDCDVIEIGSTSFTETIVEIGVGPKTMKIRRELEVSIQSDREKRDKIYLNIRSMTKQKETEGLPPDKEELLKNLIPAYHQLNSQIEEKTAKLKFLAGQITAREMGRCRIREIAHPGVKIITPNASIVLKKEYRHCSFYERKSEIAMGPY